ncbi:hypothetical protein H0G86_010505 [Trichoderma simmonsii]|uniref:Uncharacterized protein n=1 Tax=Trichoderma simmonsii TaxID=1491479 RepID=A0A8G0LPX0_9HYPO|nr:hypothetical protein H0G86_010505 [Trichoderma simmonsii]
MTRIEPSCARFLVLKALAAEIKPDAPLPTEAKDEVPPPDPGQMQLFSFVKPSLVAGDYTIEVKQKVVDNSSGTTRDLEVRGKDTTSTQTFNVTAPQFALPVADLHSTYPPQGHSDQPNIAPHVVFNDTHLPWERDPTSSGSGAPWMAVFPFDCNHPAHPELRLSPEQLADIKTALSLKPQDAPTSTFSLMTTVKDYLKLEDKTNVLGTKVKIPLFSKDPNYTTMLNDETPIQVVFISAGLYRKLFFANGKPDIQQFKHCAHVRNINTRGVTGAGMADTGMFSVVHSKRSGPTDISASAAPRSQAVHLLSLEFLEELTLETVNPDQSKTPEPDGSLIALISLHSWTYLCEPPQSVNFIDSMRKIGIQMKRSQDQELDESEKAELDANIEDAPPNCYLRCPRSVLERVAPTKTDPKKMPDRLIDKRRIMARRMMDGYGMVRYRVQNGEETVGLFRGALLPVQPVPMPKSTWPHASNNGQDYQIFDKELSMMNITYSSAWQLGRVMASSDIAFVSALMRVRMRAYQSGIKASNLLQANSSINFKSQAHFFSSMPSTLSAVREASLASTPMPRIDLRSRWCRPSEEVDTSFHRTAFKVGVVAAIKTEGSAGSNEDIPIQDLFSPTSEDWRIMHDWILDKMYLDGIPTHYLITDPCMLPPESIRFFHIDTNWRDAFIDGALSCANHTATNFNDDIRDIIKAQFDIYLNSKVLVRLPTAGDPSEKLHLPQVPTFGFFLRSKIISAFKDLIVEIPFGNPDENKGKAPILVQKRLGSDILMILLDRQPDNGDIPIIKFTQPPHQQRFCVADYLGDNEATYLFRKLTFQHRDDSLDQFNEEITYKRDTPNSIYDWDSRCLNFQNMEQLFFSTSYVPPGLQSNPFAKFHEDNWAPAEIRHLNSSFIGIQLNDTMKYLSILPPDPNPVHVESLSVAVPGHRKLVRRQLQGGDFDAIAARIDQIKKSRHGDHAPLASETISSMTVQRPLASQPELEFPLSQQTPAHPLSMLLRAPTGIASHFIAPPELELATASPVAAGARTPTYAYMVYPRETLVPADKQSFVWRDVPFAGDLIVSVQRVVPLGDSIGLREIQITIPLGPSSGRKPQSGVKTIGGPGLIPTDVGSVRVRMLNNQRWVAALAVYGVYLQIRIVPRTNPDTYSEVTADNHELSFVISGMDTGFVTDAGKGENKETGKVQVAVVECYGTMNMDQGVASKKLTIDGKTGWKDK